MTGASPWSVKGISAEERELAKQAARRAGMPIGQWLSRQIREAAELERATRSALRAGGARGPQQGMPHDGWAPAEPQPGPTAAAWRSALAAPPPDLPHPPPVAYAPSAGPAAAAPPAARPAPVVDPSRVRELERRMDEIGDIEARIAALEAAERRLATLASQIAALGARLETLEQRSEGHSTALVREMRTLGAEIEELRSRPAEAAAAASVATSTAPIERAVMRLADRLQRVEELTLPEERAGRGLLGRLFGR